MVIKNHKIKNQIFAYWKGGYCIGESFTKDNFPSRVIHTTSIKELITKQTIKQNPNIIEDEKTKRKIK